MSCDSIVKSSCCFEEKLISLFQVNTNPLLKHTVTLSVVGKSSIEMVVSRSLCCSLVVNLIVMVVSYCDVG